MLGQFQVHSKGTQPYIYMYPFFPKLPSHPGYHITLSRVPCAIQQVLVGYPFYFLKKYLFIYLFIQAVPGLSCSMRNLHCSMQDLQLWHVDSQLQHACGIQFPNRGLNPGPLHWERGVLPPGAPGKSRLSILNIAVC